jgi:histidinol dehydrogenase
MTELRLAYRGALSDMPPETRTRLIGLSLMHDGVTLRELEVPREVCASALNALAPDVRRALSSAADNIARVHSSWQPLRSEIEVEPGLRLMRRAQPLDRVGVYAPGGHAVYPSSVLMSVVPARVAGVREIIVCSPATATGLPSDVVLAAAELAGASRLFGVGGAGAIAAMALGTASVPRVDCIVGPGNAFVTEAKLQLMRDVRTDLPAGPSEIFVIADVTADLASVAAELSAQAEHGDDSAALAVLVGPDRSADLEAALAAFVRELPRAATIRQAFANQGAIVHVDSIDDALTFAESYAPEHLWIATHDAAAVAERVCNAGSIFVGLTSSVVFGDYVTGANHVLPTAGYARTHSGLSAESFMRWTTVQTVDTAAAQRLAPIAGTLARAEGLEGHARAAQLAGAGT